MLWKLNKKVPQIIIWKPEIVLVYIMLDLQTLAEFSRANCVGICAFLVPANLLATITIMVATWLRFSMFRILPISLIGFLFAAIMILHVYTWFAVGIVMTQTYILLGLAVTCLIANLGAIILNLYPPSVINQKLYASRIAQLTKKST